MASSDPAEQRRLLRAMYDKAVSLAHPDVCVPPFLPEVPEGGRIIIVGAGKAAAAMARAISAAPKSDALGAATR